MEINWAMTWILKYCTSCSFSKLSSLLGLDIRQLGPLLSLSRFPEETEKKCDASIPLLSRSVTSVFSWTLLQLSTSSSLIFIYFLRLYFLSPLLSALTAGAPVYLMIHFTSFYNNMNFSFCLQLLIRGSFSSLYETHASFLKWDFPDRFFFCTCLGREARRLGVLDLRVSLCCRWFGFLSERWEFGVSCGDIVSSNGCLCPGLVHVTFAFPKSPAYHRDTPSPFSLPHPTLYHELNSVWHVTC